tara:strand:- start:896 stop:2158 length:1263 start_codon:yes stop_codon:yes gene_type:complete
MKALVVRIKSYLNYTLTNLFVKVIGSLILIYLPTILDPIDYGEFILAFSIFNLIVVFIPSGHYESLIAVKRNNLRYDLMKIILKYTLLSFFILAIISSFFIKNTFDFLLFLNIIISGLSLGLTLTLVKYLILIGENNKASRFLFLFSLIVYSCSFFAILFTKTWESYFITSGFLGFFNIYIVNKLYINLNTFKNIQVLSLIKKTIPYILIALAGWITGYGFNYLIKLELDMERVGAFGFVFTLSNLILVITNSINLVWSSNFFEKKTKTKNYLGNNNVWNIMILLILIFSILLTIIYPYFVSYFYDNNIFLEFGKYIPLIGLSYIIYVPAWQAKNLYYYHNESIALAKYTTISVSLGVLFSLFFINQFSELGIFIGFTFNMGLQSLIISRFSIKKWNYNIPKFSLICSSTLLICFYLYYK